MKQVLSILTIITIILSCNTKGHDNQTNNNTTDTIDISLVPQWAKHAIWYQIFVERFRNGDPNNDPTRNDIQGTYPDFIPQSWKTTPWGQDWHKADDYFKDSKLKNKWDNLQLRRYGGDLQGAINKIDYLKNLGINAIYFNPLNDSPSLHKYDSRSWRHIDRNFGPNPQKDIQISESENPLDANSWKWTTADSLFLKLIKICHDNDIKIVMDYSFNHTGTEFWAFKDVKKKGAKSKVADWYEIESYDNPETTENEFSYRGWSNVSIMPEMKKDIIGDNEEYPFEGNLHSKSAKNHIFNVVKRWLDPNKDGNCNDGVDGFRLDVAAEVPKGFWVDFRKFVHKINPNAYLVGEIWWKKWPDELLLPQEFLKGDMFDAIMNYRWYREARHFFADAPNAMLPSDFVAALKNKLQGIDTERQKAMMNLLSSHDAPRVSTSLYNNGIYKYQVSPYSNVNYKIDKPDSKTLSIQKMLLIHQFTYIGAPHIWYGDEVGMWGADDPDTRKPMIWSDIKYDNEVNHPFNAHKTVNKVEQDTSLLNFYKKLIQIRKSKPVLINGKLKFIVIDDKNNTLAYSRKDTNSEIIVAFNKSSSVKTIKITLDKNGQFVNLLNNDKVMSKDKVLTITLNKLTAVILEKLE